MVTERICAFVETFEVGKDVSDSQILEDRREELLRVENDAIKITREVMPFIHLILKCRCGTVRVFHIPIIWGTIKTLDFIKSLPNTVVNLIKTVKCEKHGTMSLRYVGYIVTAQVGNRGKEKRKSSTKRNTYLILSVSTKECKSTFYRIINGKLTEPVDDEITEARLGPMINIFSISPLELNDIMYQ